MKETRQKLFYKVLVMLGKFQPDEWWDKPTIAKYATFQHMDDTNEYIQFYEINKSPNAHDECVMMNLDRLEINSNLDYEKIILIKNNKFKVATLEETIAEEKKITKAALKELWRGSVIRAKRTRDKQLLFVTDNNLTPEEINDALLLKIVETFLPELELE